ncbi:hypothetical protein HK104_006347 [Borealophlyctis nickersoniae]|nr:hypothetical protein HK104_006347 [Borealophlyctis nickersoniae]
MSRTTKKLLTWGATGLVTNNIPLKVAAAMGSVEAVNLLLKHGANFRVRYVEGEETDETPDGFGRWTGDDFQDRSAVWFALEYGHLDALRALREASCWSRLNLPASPPLRSCFEESVRGGHMRVVEMLLERTARPDCQKLLGIAIVEGYTQIARYFLERGVTLADPNRHILCAVQQKRRDIVNLLMFEYAAWQRPAIWTNADKTMLGVAVRAGWSDVAAFLLDGPGHPIDIDCFLITSVIADSVPIAKLLLAHGAKANFRESWALAVAASLGQKDMVKLLLDYGANPSKALLSAVKAKGSRASIISLLLKAGADWDHEAVKVAVNSGKLHVRAFHESGADSGLVLTGSRRVWKYPYLQPPLLLELPAEKNRVSPDGETRTPTTTTTTGGEESVERLLEMMNTGDAKELQKLKFVGPARAKKIVKARKDGVFAKPGDLVRAGFSAETVKTLFQVNLQNATPDLDI